MVLSLLGKMCLKKNVNTYGSITSYIQIKQNVLIKL